MNAATRISGCLIVRDEEDVLGASLRALWPFVDEVVVYDTGSVDGTREVAREAGARVVEGFWDDDFGAARNRALDHCAGEWVLCVDADEVIVGDPTAVRRNLSGTTGDVLTVLQQSHVRGGDGEGRTLDCLVPRVLRRERCTWQGALHERVVGTAGHTLAEPLPLPGLSLRHSGYDGRRMNGRDKAARNVRVAERGVVLARSASGTSLDEALVDLARAACGAEQHERAVAVLSEVDVAGLARHRVALAAHAAVISATAMGFLDVAHRWTALLREAGENDLVCAGFEAKVALAEGDPARAERLLRPQAHLGTVDSVVSAGLSFAVERVDALAALGRVAEAVDALVDGVASDVLVAAPVPSVRLAARDATGVFRLARSVPEPLLLTWLGGLRQDSAALDVFGEALWVQDRARTAVLVAVAQVGAALDLERAVAWSTRLRERGLEQHCPLWGILRSPTRDASVRVLSGAVLVHIGDRHALEPLRELLDGHPDRTAELLAAAEVLLPGSTAAVLAV